MTRVFVDTSAIIALLVDSDSAHASARVAFESLSVRQASLLSTSYVLVETYALLGRRVGITAVESFRESFAPLLDIVWIAREFHEKALDELVKRSSKKLSLVDVSSFLVMKEQKIDEVFAYDRHFDQEGFRSIK